MVAEPTAPPAATGPARHMLEIGDLGVEGLDAVLALARQDPADLSGALEGEGVALLFERPSNRTRNSSEMAAVALGGHPVYIQGHEVGLGVREPAADVARTLACYHAVLCARVDDHDSLVAMAAALDADRAAVPVVNLLSDRAHPCQAIADLLTLGDVFGPGPLDGLTVAYIGDADNVWRSLAIAASMRGMTTRIASPDGYGPTPAEVDMIRSLGGELTTTSDPATAADGADAIYTDVWTSMGQEEERPSRLAAFAGFTVDEDLVSKAADHAVVLHCLPAHRGEEISAAVVDGPRSVVWRQARNRMHAMRGVLAWVKGLGPATGPAWP